MGVKVVRTKNDRTISSVARLKFFHQLLVLGPVEVLAGLLIHKDVLFGTVAASEICGGDHIGYHQLSQHRINGEKLSANFRYCGAKGHFDHYKNQMTSLVT